MPRKTTTKTTTILTLTAGKSVGGEPLFWRLTEQKIAGDVTFLVQRFLYADGSRYTFTGAPIFDREFERRDEALEDIATRMPGHACTAAQFALVPHELARDSMTARFGDGLTAFWCAAASAWIGESLRDVAA